MSRLHVDREALAALHEQAYRWSLFCCGFDEDAARDTLQSVYVAILEDRARFRGNASLKTWLFAVIKRTAAHERQSGARRQRLLASLPATEETGADGLEAEAEQRAAQASTRRLVAECLARLPDRQRAVVELVYYHDLPVRECAAVLGISRGAAARHLHRAKQTLAAALDVHKGVLSHAD